MVRPNQRSRRTRSTNRCQVLQTLRAIMQTAAEDGRVAKNPCSIRSAGREESVERPMITLEELDAITAAVGERWRSMDMAAWCGLRFGELAALRQSRIDLDTETV